MNAYRIEYNGANFCHETADTAFEAWSRIAADIESRGGHAILFKQTQLPLTRMTETFSNTIIIDDMVILPEQVFAEITA